MGACAYRRVLEQHLLGYTHTIRILGDTNPYSSLTTSHIPLRGSNNSTHYIQTSHPQYPIIEGELLMDGSTIKRWEFRGGWSRMGRLLPTLTIPPLAQTTKPRRCTRHQSRWGRTRWLHPILSHFHSTANLQHRHNSTRSIPPQMTDDQRIQQHHSRITNADWIMAEMITPHTHRNTSHMIGLVTIQFVPFGKEGSVHRTSQRLGFNAL